MSEPVSLLMREFLLWLSLRRRTYAETMAAWRSTCPRQTVWEDALMEGLIHLEGGDTLEQAEVMLTVRGRTLVADK